jgi:aspartate-semialdehyde dehydrogenase
MATGGHTVGVVGAAGLLGREILGLLAAETGTIGGVRALAEKATGLAVEWRGGELDVETLSEERLAGLPVVVFCPGQGCSSRWSTRAVSAGAAVVDLSAARRLDPETPLVGLGELPSGESAVRVVSLPGAPALVAARLLAPLQARAGIEGLTATLLVPASSAGNAGLRELGRQSAALLGSAKVRTKRFPHRLAFNVIPEVMGAANGEDRAEAGFRNELRRLLSAPDLPIAATALRVPVFFGSCAVLSVELARPLEAGAARELWRSQDGIKLLDDPAAHVYPMASLAAGDDAILVGRIRGGGRRLQLFAAVDSVRLVARIAVQTALALLASPRPPEPSLIQ